MAWTTPRTANVNDVLTAAWYNLDLRDNLSYLKSAPTFDAGITATTYVQALGGNVIAQASNATLAAMGAYGPAGEAGITFGAVADSYIYRNANRDLRSNSSLSITRAASTDNALQAKADADSAYRVVVRSDGQITWGPGGASAVDVNLYRGAADLLKTDDSLEVAGSGGIKTSSLAGDIESGRYLRVGTMANPASNVDRGIVIQNATASPPNNPIGGGYLYCFGGALLYRGTSGTQTTVAAADPHCPDCGRDFALEWQNDSMGHLIVCMWCLTDGLRAGVVQKDTA